MNISFFDIFPGIGSFFSVGLSFALVRAFLIFLGLLFIYLGYRKILEPLLMIPIGLGMIFVNAGILVMPGGKFGTLFVDSLAEKPAEIIDAFQIYFLQPFYTLTFTNGLIACLVFIGIGAITELDFLITQPLLSMLLAVGAEFGTLFTLPVAVACGFNFKEAAAIAIVGSADGPIVLFTSIMLAKHLFVVISVIAYLYLSIIYFVYPYLIKVTVPKRMRAIEMTSFTVTEIPAQQKFAFAVIAGLVLSLLFPPAAPLFASFFLGVAIKEANIVRYKNFVDDVLLSGATLFLGFVLGTLLSADTVMNPKVVLIMLLGMLALLLSGLGGIASGMIFYKLSRGKVNPLVGIAAVSCVPTTAKIAQKCAWEINDKCFILPYAMGPCVAGVITSAIICACYVSLAPLLG
jgi:oxaloacetate decarboxylase beta subunit